MRQKSLRQLAKEPGISASYLSQVNHGKRPASASLVGGLNSYQESVKQNIVNLPRASGYNPNNLGISLAVGQRTLDP